MTLSNVTPHYHSFIKSELAISKYKTEVEVMEAALQLLELEEKKRQELSL
jgi:hypothetical protein